MSFFGVIRSFGFQRAGRLGTALSAIVALASFVAFEPRKPASEVAASNRAAPTIAGLEDLDFTMDPTGPKKPLELEISRRVLALYNGAETILEDDEQTGRPNAIVRKIAAEVSVAHRLAELPLNHLGLAVDHQDVTSDPLPGPEDMRKYRGVLAWFGDNKLTNPNSYLSWLIEQIDAGRKVVVIGDPAQIEDLDGGHPNPRLISDLLARLGGEWVGRWPEDPSAISVVKMDDTMIGFERPIPERIEAYQRYHAHPGSEVYLTLAHSEEPNQLVRRQLSDVVWTSRTGGFSLGALTEIEDHIEDRFVTRWLVNPFRFFERAFGVEGWPRVDFTTLNGRRIYYGHIDGDGLDTISELDYKSRCGALIRDEILKKYDLPFTASVVVGLTAPPPLGRGTLDDVDVARSIFALDNVEVGSHGLAHPMDWRAGSRAELSVPDLPDYVFTPEAEIAKSVDYINRELAPPTKPCRIMLWTGSCNPTEAQLEWAYRLHLRNLNGGDPRMDAFYPSYAHLVAPVHPVGKFFQYYTSAANDYIHTQDWTPPYYRFQNVIQTLERTAAPRRIVPANVYFHFYSARNMAAMTGLERVMNWVAAQPLAPMFASEYVDIARDFHWARLAKIEPDVWLVQKGKHLRTVRFDDPKIYVDLAESTGVYGYLNVPELGATYVHLSSDPNALIHVVREDPHQIRLEQASHWVDRLELAEDEIAFVTRGIGKRTFIFANLAPGGRWVVAAGGASIKEARTAPDGRLEIKLDDHSPANVPVVLKKL